MAWVAGLRTTTCHVFPDEPILQKVCGALCDRTDWRPCPDATPRCGRVRRNFTVVLYSSRALEPATPIAPVPPNLPCYDGRKLQGHFVGAYPRAVSGGGPPRTAARLLMKQFVNAPADSPLAAGPTDLTARRLTQPVLEEWHRMAQARRQHLEWRESWAPPSG